MRKKVLFVMPSLTIGGAEKSLLNLLKYWDYEKYDVDLYLYSQNSSMVKFLDKHVHLLQGNGLFQDMFHKHMRQSVSVMLKRGRYDLALLRIIWGVLPQIYRLMHKPYYRNTNLDWYIQRAVMERFDTHYDVAIGYMEGASGYYIKDCVKADRKIAWIHTDYSAVHPNLYLDKVYLETMQVVTVSENSKKELIKAHPKWKNKIQVIPNIIDTQKIDYLKNEHVLEMPGDKVVKIVSVGRLVKLKGFDICIEAAKILKDKKLDFYWYFLGDGEEKENLQRHIDQLSLQNYCYMAGAKNNPYAYIQNALLCVQMSQYEGRGMVIEEEQYLLKPIVASDIGPFRDMIQDEETGLLVKRDAQAVADAILRIYNDDILRNKIIDQLACRQKNDSEIVRQVEMLIEELPDDKKSSK